MELKDEELGIQNVMHVDVKEKNNKNSPIIAAPKHY